MHQEPQFFHKFEVLSNHFVELVAPFFIFLTRRLKLVGGFIQILFQVNISFSITRVLLYLWFPHGLENLEKWENFQSEKSQGILSRLEKSGNFIQKYWKNEGILSKILENEGILSKILEKWGHFSQFLFFSQIFNWSIFIK